MDARESLATFFTSSSIIVRVLLFFFDLEPVALACVASRGGPVFFGLMPSIFWLSLRLIMEWSRFSCSR